MDFEIAAGESEAKVRGTRLRREVTRSARNASVHLLVSPLAPPRLWGMIADAVLSAFENATNSVQCPGALALVESVSAASVGAVARVRERLIEPNLQIDADLGVVAVEGDTIIFGVSPGTRLYRARKGLPERLHAQECANAAIAQGALFVATERAEPGDIYLLGNKEAFTLRAISNLATTLARGNRLTSAEIADTVLGPCREDGVGASLVVVRAA